jgi:hypothetical protein
VAVARDQFGERDRVQRAIEARGQDQTHAHAATARSTRAASSASASQWYFAAQLG